MLEKGFSVFWYQTSLCRQFSSTVFPTSCEYSCILLYLVIGLLPPISLVMLHSIWDIVLPFKNPDVYILPFLLCFSLLFFSQLFLRPSQTTILLFCISFPWRWSLSLSPIPCHEPQFIVQQALYLSDLGP